MKIKILALITAMLMFSMVFSGCGEEENTATPDEAVSDTATADEAVTSVSASTAPSTSATQPTGNQTQKTTTAPGTTQPTTQKPVQDNIPEDTISGGNINPNLYGIIDLVVQEMNELAIRTISLDYSKLSIKVGESAQLKISYNPENAVPKTCKVSSGNKCVQASIDDDTVTVTGKSAGTALITVTSYNGATAYCNVTVTKSEEEKPAVITDDTVLPHAKVCTRANADRWRAAVDEYCSGEGMEKNGSLSGETVTVSTSSYTADGSFNSYKEQILSDAAAQIDAYTDKKYTEYSYNCALEQNGSEFTISVTLYKTEA